MKKYLFFAASALALASCSSDDFLGENPGTAQNATTAINFGGEAGKITRATSNEGSTAKMLDGQFLVYGVKKVGDMRHNVFVNYKVWDATAGNTTTNTKGWEYVGKNDGSTYGSANITLDKNQTIKFWDYSATEYNFVAGSPIDAFIYKQSVELTSGTTITEATVSKLAGHINPNKAGTKLTTDPVYIAAPVKVVKDNYKQPVKFTFQRQQSMVRVGFYETIPGYSITGINFYDADGVVSTTNHNIILTSSQDDYFVGGTNVSGTVKYDWTTTDPSYKFTYDFTTLEKSKNWYAGELAGVHAKTSSETNVAYLYGTDQDMAATGYFTVLPTPATTTPTAILIKCDYTLTSDDDSGETIEVKGATAAIPAAFSKWDVNTRYTYLFKISQNTNGTTSAPSDPHPEVGLYPITFDAVVTDMTDKTNGTITTVTTPSITTYQKGSVTNNGIEYKSGTEIDVTVTDANGNVQPLTAGGTAVGSVAVYKFTNAITEAEIQVKGITGATAVTGATIDSNVLKFTPDTEGYYAIRYLTQAAEGTKPAAYTYKVVYVKAATTGTGGH